MVNDCRRVFVQQRGTGPVAHPALQLTDYFIFGGSLLPRASACRSGGLKSGQCIAQIEGRTSRCNWTHRRRRRRTAVASAVTSHGPAGRADINRTPQPAYPPPHRTAPSSTADSIASIFACSAHPPLMSFLIAIDHSRRRTDGRTARARAPTMPLPPLMLLMAVAAVVEASFVRSWLIIQPRSIGCYREHRPART